MTDRTMADYFDAQEVVGARVYEARPNRGKWTIFGRTPALALIVELPDGRVYEAMWWLGAKSDKESFPFR